ncbi:MAG: lipid-A-disaccharide synthase [Cytophagaceae bacterium]
MKYYIIAGERSGDLHASNLAKALKSLDEEAQIRGVGGKHLNDAGAMLFKNYQEISFMGFAEVIINLSKILSVMKQVKSDILSFKPDVVILVDFAGFNMKIAKFSRQNNLKVFYYISPKVWAWNTSRAWKIKKFVNKMYVIMPFEKDFYRQFDFDVDYVGNPVKDAITGFKFDTVFLSKNSFPDKPLIAVLPGSRKQEVLNTLELIVSVLPAFPEYHFVVAAVSNLPKSYYEKYIGNPSLSIVYDDTYNLLANAKAAVVTSGTATLETALLKVPQVVVYKTSRISYLIAKALIKVRFISLVNLITDKLVVKELIQQDFNQQALINELQNILEGKGREQMLKDYNELERKIGEEGASKRAAELMFKEITNSN